MQPRFTDAYLLRSVAFREKDAVVTLLTPDQGLVAAMARGARASRKRFGGALDYFCRLSAELKPGRGAMGQLLSVDVVHSFETVRNDYERYAVGSHFLEIFRLAAREGDPSPEPFALLDRALAALDDPAADPRSLVRVVALRVIALTGYAPDQSHCAHCGEALDGGACYAGLVPACAACAPPGAKVLGVGARKTLQAALEIAHARMGTLRLPRPVDAEVGPIVEHALTEALGSDIRSLRALRQLWNP